MALLEGEHEANHERGDTEQYEVSHRTIASHTLEDPRHSQEQEGQHDSRHSLGVSVVECTLHAGGSNRVND